jgi:hypothetical protein
MNDEEGDLWPDEITVDVVSPAMILNKQADALARRTQGMVRGDVSIEEVTHGPSTLFFDLVAPAASYRRRILAVRFSESLVYPAVLTSHDKIELPRGPTPATNWGLQAEEARRSRVAYTPSEFERYLAAIFSSGRVKSAVLSLIAKSNEVRQCLSVRRDSRDSTPDPTTRTTSEHSQPEESPVFEEDSLPMDSDGGS